MLAIPERKMARSINRHNVRVNQCSNQNVKAKNNGPLKGALEKRDIYIIAKPTFLRYSNVGLYDPGSRVLSSESPGGTTITMPCRALVRRTR